uniref:Homeobox domain-containing protein n=1 Tax=Opuntia streptacantha TaxID=393608 RepID=A0A7C9EM49_OPUST
MANFLRMELKRATGCLGEERKQNGNKSMVSSVKVTVSLTITMPLCPKRGRRRRRRRKLKMELGLSLGNRGVGSGKNDSNNNLGRFCMGLGRSTAGVKLGDRDVDDDQNLERRDKVGSSSSSEDPPPPPPPAPPRLQLDLLPFSPVPRASHRFPWLPDNLSSEPGSSDGPGPRTLELNRRRTAEDTEEQSSPNSGTSSFMEFSLYTTTNSGGGPGKGRREEEGGENGNFGKNHGQEVMIMGLGRGGGEGGGQTTSRGSDDDENGLSSSTRKKLRLSKEQSAFLEESFKEHHTLNPKQKLALAKQLNLRPRQVEVWFQNRRARTKLKQTEVDCEYLKRCCETLTEENRRLQKELQELRALKTSQPFFMHLPATTLTMCPSCERVAPASGSSSTPAAASPSPGSSAAALLLGKPKSVLPFSTTNGNGQAHRPAS